MVRRCAILIPLVSMAIFGCSRKRGIESEPGPEADASADDDHAGRGRPGDGESPRAPGQPLDDDLDRTHLMEVASADDVDPARWASSSGELAVDCATPTPEGLDAAEGVPARPARAPAETAPSTSTSSSTSTSTSKSTSTSASIATATGSDQGTSTRRVGMIDQHGRIAYAARGTDLLLVDVCPSSQGTLRAARILDTATLLPIGIESIDAVRVAGSTLYAGGCGGIVGYSIGDRGALHPVAAWYFKRSDCVVDLRVADERLVATVDAGRDAWRVEMLDVSKPDVFDTLGRKDRLRTNTYRDVALVDGFAYVSMSEILRDCSAEGEARKECVGYAQAVGLDVIDLTGASPRSHGNHTYELFGATHLASRGALLLAWTDQGLVAVDVADPAAPRFVSRLPLALDGRDVSSLAIDGDRAYLVVSGRGVQTVDVKDPFAMRALAMLPFPNAATLSVRKGRGLILETDGSIGSFSR